MITNPKGLLTILFSLQYNELVKRNQYQGRVKQYNEIDFDSLVAYAAKATNINESNIRMSMDAIFDAVQYFVTTGHGVELEGLGTFSFGIKCKATFSEAEAESQLDGLRQKFINFLPALAIRKAMNAAKLVKEVDTRNLPQTSEIIVSNVGIAYENTQASRSNPTQLDPTKEILIKNGSVIRIDGANLKKGIVPAVTVGSDGSVVTLSRVLFKNQQDNITAFYLVTGGVTTPQPIASIKVTDSEGVEKFSYTGYVSTGDPVIRNVIFETYNLNAGNNTLALESGSTHALAIRGNNLEEVVPTLNGEPLTPIRISDTQLVYRVAISTGDVLGVNGVTYNFLFSGSGPAVQSISANGVTVQNGGSSTFIEGMNYHFVLDGKNLNKLGQSDIQGPAGAVFGNFVTSDEKAEFDARFVDGGQLTIGSIFSITLEKTTAELKFGVENEGTVSATVVSDGGAYWLTFEVPVTSGTPNVSNFYFGPLDYDSPSHITTGVTFDASLKKVVFSLGSSWPSMPMPGKLLYKEGDTTILNIKVVK